jgi:hypothetical protein
MPDEEKDGLNPAIADALEAVLGQPEPDDIELYSRLATVIRNCVTDNYDVSDVRAVIQLAFADDVVEEIGEQGE